MLKWCSKWINVRSFPNFKIQRLKKFSTNFVEMSFSNTMYAVTATSDKTLILHSSAFVEATFNLSFKESCLSSLFVFVCMAAWGLHQK